MSDEKKPEETESGTVDEEEMRRQIEEQFRRQKVSDLLVQYMISLSTLAYMKMGITEDTREVMDLEQARLAIDGYKALLDSIGERLGKQDFQALSGALASMQLTFVQASEGGEKEAKSGSASGGADEGGGKPEGEESGSGKKQGGDPASRLWVPGKD